MHAVASERFASSGRGRVQLVAALRAGAAACWTVALLTLTFEAGRIVHLGGPSRLSLHIYPFDLAIAGTLGLWALRLAIDPEVAVKIGPPIPFAALCTLFAAALIGVPFSAYPALALGMVGRLWMGLLFYLYTVNNAVSPSRLALPLAAALTLQLAVAGGQAVRQGSLGLVALGERHLDPALPGIAVVAAHGHRWLRPYGLTVYPNLLGGLAACCMVPLACMLPRRLSGAGIAICAALLALTLSRGAWLAAAAGAAFFALARHRWHGARSWPLPHFPSFVRESGCRNGALAALRRAHPLVPFGAVAVTAALALSPARTVLAARFDPANTLEQQSIGARMVEIDQALAMIRRRPLLGVGANCYEAAIRPLLPAAIVAHRDAPVVHNAYLIANAEIGVLGGPALGAALLAPAWHALRRRAEVRSLALAAALCACATIGLFEFSIWSSPTLRLLWVALLGVWSSGAATAAACDVAGYREGRWNA